MILRKKINNQSLDIFDYTVKNHEEIAKEFETNLTRGLSEKEIERRFLKYGRNVLTLREARWWHILFRQFKSAFIYLLFAAAVITLFLGQPIEALIIILFLFINAGLGFYQEYHSEKTMQFLKQCLISYVRVVREEKTKIIPANNLVPGDIIILKTGDKIPADIRFLETEGLIVDETVLTGESMPIYKKEDILPEKAKSYHRALNIGFSGTVVVKGEAKGIVLATGNATTIGRIAKLTGETKRISNFEKGISRFASFIFKLVGLTLVIVFLANILIKGESLDAIQLLVFSIALTVSVIPEALPLVTTFSLSQAARRLARRKILVKRISAVEDLGGIEVLCSDKTGTLTENKLAIAEIYSKNSAETLFYAALGTAFEQKKKTEPFDIAIWQKIDSNQAQKINLFRKLKELPFDPKKKRSVSLVIDQDGKNSTLITVGAPEEIIKLSHNLNNEEKIKLTQWIKQEGKKGNRVLAIAKKDVNNKKKETLEIELEKEDNFDILGAISFADSIKKTTDDIVKEANELGIKIKIITGDSREVAGTVAFQIGLIDSPDKVIIGEEWDSLNEEEKTKAMDKYQVFARFSPEQKYSLVKKLQSKYEVGFLGEGINDAPVLKAAGVSLVVESGADIAKDAADIVILRKDLRVIISGVKEGRRSFINTIKYIKATLTSNFGNFFAIATTSLIIDFLPMLPLQILLVNLLSDFPMISISTDTVDKSELKSPKKYNVNDIAAFCIILGFLSTIFDFIFFGLFYRISPQVLQTNWFIASILTELALLFSIRTKFFFAKAQKPSGTVLWLSIIAALMTIILPFTAFGQKIFGFVRPTNLMIIIFLVVFYFVCSEFLKLFYYKKFNNDN